MAATIKKKFVIVGDCCSGKTGLVKVFIENDFPKENVPSFFEDYVTDIEVDAKQIQLTLSDNSGSEDYGKLRSNSYRDTDVILLCYSIGSPCSLENIDAVWEHEIRHFCPNAPIILVGNKKELRDDPYTLKRLAEDRKQQLVVKFEEGRAMAEKIKACAYLECSAKSNEGVREVFETAVRVSLKADKKKKNKWWKLF